MSPASNRAETWSLGCGGSAELPRALGELLEAHAPVAVRVQLVPRRDRALVDARHVILELLQRLRPDDLLLHSTTEGTLRGRTPRNFTIILPGSRNYAFDTLPDRQS